MNPATESKLAEELRKEPQHCWVCKKNPRRLHANSGDRPSSEEPFWKPVTTRFWNPKIPSTHRQQTASEFSGRILNKPQLRVWIPKNSSAKCRLDSEHPGAPVCVSCLRQSSEELVNKRSTHSGTHKLVHEPLSHGVSFPHDVSEMGAATNTEVASLGCAASSGFLNLLTLSSALIRTALSHAESVRRVEALRGFPLPVAATAFTARCPQPEVPARRPKLRLRSEERGLGDDRAKRHVNSRIHAPGRSVRDEAVLPNSAGRSSLSLCAPLRISPLEPRPQRRGASSHGLPHSTGQVH